MNFLQVGQVRILNGRELTINPDESKNLLKKVQDCIESKLETSLLPPPRSHGSKLSASDYLNFIKREFVTEFILKVRTQVKKTIKSVVPGLKNFKKASTVVDNSILQEYWNISPTIQYEYYRHVRDLRIGYDNQAKALVWCDLYEYWNSLMEYLSKEIQAFSPQSVLELGSGYGRNLVAITERNKSLDRVVALDFSFVGLLATELNFRKQNENRKCDLELICSDFRETKLENKSVDVSFSVWSLPYGCENSPENLEKIIDEAIRVTKKGIVLIEPDFESSLYGKQKKWGFWNYSALEKVLKSKNLNFRVSDYPIRVNPFVNLKAIVISLAQN